MYIIQDTTTLEYYSKEDGWVNNPLFASFYKTEKAAYSAICCGDEFRQKISLFRKKIEKSINSNFFYLFHKEFSRQDSALLQRQIIEKCYRIIKLETNLKQ